MSDSRWVDLQNTLPVHAWAIHKMVHLGENGAGRVILLTLVDHDEDMLHLLIDPDVAQHMAWEIMGVYNDFIEQGCGLPLAVDGDVAGQIQDDIIQSLQDMEED